MAITLGTGFGSAFMSHNTPVVNGDEVPDLGCVYHLPFRGFTADDYFSTRWFLNNYTYRTGKKLPGVKELAALTETDQTAKDLFVEFGNNIGEFLAPWLISFKAEVLVVGGNISNGWSLFSDSFSKSLKMRNCTTRLEISELKEDAALLGSAYLLDDKFWNEIQPALPYM
jgi:glucokinase